MRHVITALKMCHYPHLSEDKREQDGTEVNVSYCILLKVTFCVQEAHLLYMTKISIFYEFV